MNRDPDPYRLYAIVRGDLNMTPGKLSAQTGHAYLDAFLKAEEMRPETIPLYKINHGIKVTLRAKNLSQLERAYKAAKEAGIPCVMITDLGYTVFEGKPTITCMGLGPAKEGEIKHFTKRFQLLK